jgi:hypothetical protein
MMWGKRKENGIWLSHVRRRRLMFKGHDSLYLAWGRLRLRLMRPSRYENLANDRA